MNKLLYLSVCLLVITGCATTTRTGCTQHVERDLTQAWDERVYWCAPSGYKNAPSKQTAYIKDTDPDSETQFAQSNSFFDQKEISNNSSPSFSEAQGKTLPNTVRFYRHDSEFSTSDIDSLKSQVRPLKVRGCRLTSEPSFLNFSRALRVRNELQKRGYAQKITILADNSCIGSKTVEVR